MQGRQNKSGALAGILLPLGLICLFAFCSLLLALMGGQAYKSIQNGVDDSFDSTVTANYLRTKLAQNNRAGAISLRTEGDIEVLVIASGTGNERYETRIYVQDGRLMENYAMASAPFSPEGGMSIAKVRSCSFSIEDGLFTAEIESPAGYSTRTVFLLAQGEET